MTGKLNQMFSRLSDDKQNKIRGILANYEETRKVTIGSVNPDERLSNCAMIEEVESLRKQVAKLTEQRDMAVDALRKVSSTIERLKIEV
jgi:hypothetical protein